MTPEEDQRLGCIGHVRMDFGHRGQEFWHTWWPRGPEELNSPEFKAELQEVVDELRTSVLKDLAGMTKYCWGHGGEVEGIDGADEGVRLPGTMDLGALRGTLRQGDTPARSASTSVWQEETGSCRSSARAWGTSRQDSSRSRRVRQHSARGGVGWGAPR